MATDPRAETGIVVNEIDAKIPGVDTAEFVELFGPANAALDDQSLVLFNGNGDQAYRVIDLDGQNLDANGYFLAGNPGVAGVEVTFANGVLQNGPDAVALYDGDFPAGGTPTTRGLVDAVVCGTNDADDADLLAALGQTTQYDEDLNGDDDNASLGRVPDGTGDFQAATPTPGAANGVVPPPPPPAGAVLISEVQGDGGVSPLAGRTVTIEAVVTADFRTSPDDPADTLGGVFVQEQTADEDGDPATSEGLFVFLGDSTAGVGVGDVVRVDGTVEEFFDKTGLSDVTSIEVVGGADAAITPATIVLPLDQPFFRAADNPLEAFEGMVATLPQELTVTQLFGLERFGTLHLSAANPYTDDGRLAQPTQVALPGDAADAVQDVNDLNRILIDDGTNDQNVWIPDYLVPENPLVRGGGGVAGLTGILDFDFGNYRVRLDETVDFESDPRPTSPPDVGGGLKVASFNVLNYFTTIDDGTNDARGADSGPEFALQEDKIVAALSELDADVVGLIELENNGFGADSAIRSIVSALNAETGAPTYSFVDAGPGTIGTDAITVGMIYKPDVVRLAPGTEAAVLDDPSFTDPVASGRQLNRPALAATFEEIDTGAEFTLAVNHFKSKGSLSGDARDADQGDGQGNNNFTREGAAIKLAEWLATNPTGTEDADRLIVGDLNSYALEDPIRALEGQGYTDLANDAFDDGDFTYGYRFSGQWGSLDYALANAELLDQVTGAADWHINADEPQVLDYNDDVVDAGERSFEAKSNEAFDLVRPDAFRSSDHDPVLVGLDLAPEGPAEPSFTVLGPRERDATGTPGNDLIVGNNKPNTIDGRGGDDLILGNDGRDALFGGAGKDVLLGGNGDDKLDGGGGDDVLAGFKGADVLGGGEGSDVYAGGKGVDVFVFADNSLDGGAEVVRDFENDRDKIDVSGLDFDAYAVFGNGDASVIEFYAAATGGRPAGEVVERVVLLDVRPGQIDDGDFFGLPAA